MADSNIPTTTLSPEAGDIPHTSITVERHVRHYETEYLIFLVGSVLFRVPVGRLRESEHFRNMLESENTGEAGEGKSDEHPIILKGVSSFEMESFMDVIQATLFVDEKKLGWKQKAAALHLATMWGFKDLRSGLISFMGNGIDSTDPVDRIETSLKCRVEEWFHPAIRALCERVAPLTASEGERLGFTLFAAICQLRETYPPLPPNSCYCKRCGGNHRPHTRSSDLPSSIQSSSVLKFPHRK